MKENHIFEKHVFVCTSGKTCPTKANVEEFASSMKNQITEKGLKHKIRINKSGCLGWCTSGAVMVVYPEAVWYTDLDQEKVTKIFDEHILNNKPVESLMYKKGDLDAENN